MVKSSKTNNGDHSYPITDEWRAAVRRELDRRGRGAQAELAKAVGCSTGTLADLLNTPAHRTSNLVTGIHKFLGWPAPTPPIVSRDTGELRLIYDLMSDGEREAYLKMGQAILKMRREN